MQFHPNPDGFLANLQEGGRGRVTYTRDDDLVVVVGLIQAHTAILGFEHGVRVTAGGLDSLWVTERQHPVEATIEAMWAEQV